MNPTSYLWIVFAIALVVDSSCRKKEPGPKIDVDKDFLSYVYFNNGTRWVYKNVNAEEFDTCIVSGAGSRYLHHSQEMNDSDPLYAQYGFLSDDRGLPVQVLTTCNPVNDKDDLSQILNTSQTFYMYNNIVGSAYSYNLFKYPFLKDTLSSDIDDETTYIKERLDSLIIQTQTFHNIITTRHDFQQGGSLIREITYAKGIGPIRKVYWDGSTWELTEYSIE